MAKEEKNQVYLRDLRALYGNRIDSILGCVGLLEELFESASENERGSLALSELFEALDNRYHELVGNAHEKGRRVDERLVMRYETLCDNTDELTHNLVYDSARLVEFRNGVDEIKQRERIREKRGELGLTALTTFSSEQFETGFPVADESYSMDIN